MSWHNLFKNKKGHILASLFESFGKLEEFSEKEKNLVNREDIEYTGTAHR
jgi:hypothetical protein